jgi:hypothetical protein
MHTFAHSYKFVTTTYASSVHTSLLSHDPYHFKEFGVFTSDEWHKKYSDGTRHKNSPIPMKVGTDGQAWQHGCMHCCNWPPQFLATKPVIPNVSKNLQDSSTKSNLLYFYINMTSLYLGEINLDRTCKITNSAYICPPPILCWLWPL